MLLLFQVRKFQRVCRGCTCVNVMVYRVLGVVDAFSCAEWSKEMYVAAKDRLTNKVLSTRKKVLRKLADNSLRSDDGEGDSTAAGTSTGVGETTDDEREPVHTLGDHVAVFSSMSAAETGIVSQPGKGGAAASTAKKPFLPVGTCFFEHNVHTYIHT